MAGTFLGAAVDRGIFGGGATREGPRTANLAVQSAAYGEALPRLYGRMRVAGNLVWTAGIRESRSTGGGGKRGPATASYSYGASFAVIVSARPVVRIERIWADGKLLRASDGGLIYPAVIRAYPGSEDQPVDPLIAAAEGIDAAPAYRGRAYVVFEDLPLADYGNRIPNLTFEVVADPGAIAVAAIACDIGGGMIADGGGSGLPVISGFAASRAGSIRQTLEQLAVFSDLAFAAGDGGLALRDTAPPPVAIAADCLGASAADAGSARHETRQAATVVPDALVIGFSDPARDFQPGLQRAVRRTPAVQIEQRDLAAALDAPAAKALAEAILRRAIAARTTGVLTVPWRFAALRPGDIVRAGSDPEPWRIRRVTVAGGTVELEVERIAATGEGGHPAADAGRVYTAGDAPQGPTMLHVLDLPPLPGALPATPRLLLAAAGTSPGWRRAAIVMSSDDGGSYAAVATIDAPSVIGTAATAFAVGNTDRWDRRTALDVALLDDAMHLDGTSEAAVLAGANLALVGDEIVQFARAEQLGPARYRLSTFLRGRRGTEAEAARHVAGERFVLLDPDRLGVVGLGAETIGTALRFKALGSGNDVAAAPAIAIRPAGAALRPLSPVALTVGRTADGWLAAWTRRSRGGFAWTDGADAPLAEEIERYRIRVRLDGAGVREVDVAEPRWTYAAADFAADGGPGARRLDIAVAQLSAVAGAGAAASCGLDLPV